MANGDPAPPGRGGAGFPSNTIRLCWGLPQYQVASWILIHPAIWPQETWAKNWGVPLWGVPLPHCVRWGPNSPQRAQPQFSAPIVAKRSPISAPQDLWHWHLARYKLDYYYYYYYYYLFCCNCKLPNIIVITKIRHKKFTNPWIYFGGLQCFCHS